jgi:hypothetical protein
MSQLTTLCMHEAGLGKAHGVFGAAPLWLCQACMSQCVYTYTHRCVRVSCHACDQGCSSLFIGHNARVAYGLHACAGGTWKKVPGPHRQKLHPGALDPPSPPPSPPWNPLPGAGGTCK